MNWKFSGLALLLLLWAIALTLWTAVFTGVIKGPWGQLAAAIFSVLAATAVTFIPEVWKNVLRKRSESKILETSIQRPVLPGMLPRDVRGFIGRVNELERIEHAAVGGSVVVTAIGGMAGIGKTSLAVHAAHLMLDAFPDGHLYADLRGYTDGQKPAQAEEILLLFLPRLGVPINEVPVNLEQRSALFREKLSSRRAIVVLDNVATEQQVRPLLPGTGSSLVLITSRDVLGGLDVDEHIDLNILSVSEAIELITSRLGEQRASSDLEGVNKIAELCGYLPLAVWISSQLLVTQPAWPISRLVELLEDEQQRLESLQLGDQQMRSVFAVSYRELGNQDAKVFRFLGMYPGPDFSDNAVAELAALDVAETGQLLDRLARAHLVISDSGRRFRMHDLLRLFAREMSVLNDSEDVRAQAISRLVSHFSNLLSSLDKYLNAKKAVVMARSTESVAFAPFDRHAALVVFQAELPNIMAVFRLAADQHLYRGVCTIFDVLTSGLWLLWRPDDILAASQVALDAAKVLGDQTCEAEALDQAGRSYVHKGEFNRAVSCHNEAFEIYKSRGDAAGEAKILVGLGFDYREMGQLSRAVEYHKRALDLSRTSGDRWLEQHALNNLGFDYEEQEKSDLAVSCFQEGLIICRQIHDRPGEGHHLGNIGLVYMGQRQFGKAIEFLKSSMQVYRETGNERNEGGTLITIGIAYRGMNQLGRAIEYHKQAEEFFRRSDYKDLQADSILSLATDYERLGQAQAMISCLQEAVKILRQIGEFERAIEVEQWLITKESTHRRWQSLRLWGRKKSDGRGGR